MRTVGTFQDVYTAAKGYVRATTEELFVYGRDLLSANRRPMNAVVRREGDRWMLESGLNSGENADFEVTLEAFDSWFFEGYMGDDSYAPSESDIDDFVKAHANSNDDSYTPPESDGKEV